MLTDLLRVAHERGWGVEDLLLEAHRLEIPLHKVLDAIDFDWPDLEQRDGRLVLVLDHADRYILAPTLVAVCGGFEEAQAAVRRSHWRDLDLNAELSVWQVRTALDAAYRTMGNAVALQDALYQARAHPSLARQVERTLKQVALTWPWVPLSQLPDETQLDLASGFNERGQLHELLHDAALSIGLEQAARLLLRWHQPKHALPTGQPAYWPLMLQLVQLTPADTWPSIKAISSDLPPEAWIPYLMQCGVRTNTIVLAAREAGLLVPELARLLSTAGLSDSHILSSLLANFGGPPRALNLLLRAGWIPARLASTARQEGLLDPEIREHLAALGVSQADIKELLKANIGPARTSTQT